MKMPWGKFKGQKVEDIPDAYLTWMLENVKGNDELLKEAQDQLDMRRGHGKVVKEDGSHSDY